MFIGFRQPLVEADGRKTKAARRPPSFFV